MPAHPWRHFLIFQPLSNTYSIYQGISTLTSIHPQTGSGPYSFLSLPYTSLLVYQSAMPFVRLTNMFSNTAIPTAATKTCTASPHHNRGDQRYYNSNNNLENTTEC